MNNVDLQTKKKKKCTKAHQSDWEWESEPN